MLSSRSISLKAAISIAAASLALLSGCNKPADPIVQAQAVKKEEPKAAAGPGIAEVKAIAEEAFIYGLPIVMNYAVMNEFVVDKNSGQYKGPFNAIANETRVFTPKDTAVVTPNSDTPYSMLWLDLRAEPMVISVPAVDKKRYYSVQLIDGNTYNYGYIGSRATGSEAGNYLVVGPDWKGETPPGIKKVFQSTTPFGLTIFRTQLFNAADMPNVVKVQAGYKAQPLSGFLKQPAPPAAPEIDFRSRPPRPASRTTSSPTSTRRCSTCRSPRRTAASERGWPASASGPARPSSSRTFRWSTRPRCCWR